MDLRSGFLPVGIDHQLYFEDIGLISNEALFLVHGGPGSGCEEKHRTKFDLNKYRIVLFDQRGCGKSQSEGELHENTTEFIIKDIELLRKRLRLESFSLAGSSWGVVPAVGYAAQFPARIKTLFLNSPFLARQKDFEWSYTPTGVARLLPADWQLFSEGRQGEELVRHYYQAVVERGNTAATLRWLNWEGAQYFYSRPQERVDFSAETLSPYWKNVARIQVHFAQHHFFLGERGILPWIEKIAATPIRGVCLQGELDIITPPTESAELQRAWPQMEYRLIPGADHKLPDAELLKL